MLSCIENKKFYEGIEINYKCELLFLSEGFGVLRYKLTDTSKIDDLILLEGTITYAFYWESRPYVLYKWYSKDRRILANYFNIADSVKLEKNIFSWRDLIVDVLVLPSGKLEILDENEIPSEMEGSLREYIKTAKLNLLHKSEFIIKETDKILSELEMKD